MRDGLILLLAVARYRCALAMEALAGRGQMPPGKVAMLLRDAANYFKVGRYRGLGVNQVSERTGCASDSKAQM